MSEELKKNVTEEVAEEITENNTNILSEGEKKRLKEEAKEILDKHSNDCYLEEKVILKNKNKNIYSKVKSFFSFEKFEFLEQSNEKKEEIALLIKKQNNPDKLYWMEILLSTLIATFGLLQNSVAVIIGAMLIAPLIRPMQGMSFAMARGQSSFFWKTTSLLFKSVVISIVVSFLFALLIPLKVEQPEILARISPNILDLFIAIFSAIIALLSLGYERLSASVAGVAMAASLMPPLAVVGIELSLGNPIAAWGSFLLFFVNFLAILLVGVIVLLAYGFTPTQELKKQVSVRKILTLLVIILFTSIPLYSSLSNISNKIEAERESKELLEKLIPEKIHEAKLKGLKVLTVTDDSIKMIGELQVPENIKIFNSTKTSIIAELEEYFDKDVIIDFETIRTANFSSPDISNKLKNDIVTAFKTYLHDIAPSFTSLQLTVSEVDKNVWEVSSILSIPDGEFLTDEIKDEFAKMFSENFDEKIAFKWVTVAGSPKQVFEKELTKNQIIQANITKNIQEFLSHPDMNGVKIENITIDIVENSETNDIENIRVAARVLYLHNNKLAENTTDINATDTLSELLGVSENSETSIETSGDNKNKNKNKNKNNNKNKNKNKNELIQKNINAENSELTVYKQEPEITESLVQTMQSLPYSNITLELDYIPYTKKTIIMDSVKNDKLNTEEVSETEKDEKGEDWVVLKSK